MKSTVLFQILLLSSAVVALPFVPMTSCQWNRGPSLGTSDQSILVSQAPDHRVQLKCEPLNPNATPDTLIGALWRNNCDLVKGFLENNFAVAAATTQDGSFDDAFRYYSVQDYYYLLATIPFKLSVLESRRPTPMGKYATGIKKVVDSMHGSIQYADTFRKTLKNDLDIRDSIIENRSFKGAGAAYVDWLQRNVNDDKYAFQVSRIACIYGWSELAHALDARNDINKDTLFYKQWVMPNLKWTYGNEMLDRLNKPVSEVTQEEFERYNTLFQEGMRHEIEFFESAIGKKPRDSL